MIKVLFKSEELLIAADSESAVVYGNTTKNTVIEYLSNLTPKNGEEAMSIIMLYSLQVSMWQLNTLKLPLKQKWL